MVSELAGEGAVPPQLPTPASHAELRCRRRDERIRRGSSLRRGVNLVKTVMLFTPSTVFVPLSLDGNSRSRSVEISSRVLVNPLVAVFNRTSWSRSVRNSSRVLDSFLVAFRSWRRSMENMSAELVNSSLVIIDCSSWSRSSENLSDSRSRSVEILSRVLVACNNNLSFSESLTVRPSYDALTVPSPLPSAPKAPEKDSELYPQWNRCNALITLWILRSVTTAITNSVLWLDVASKIWEDFKRRFSDAFRISDLLKEIYSLKQGSSTVIEYHTPLNMLWNELLFLRPLPKCECNPSCQCDAIAKAEEYLQNDQVISFLKGLDDNFAMLGSYIMLMEPLPEMNTAFAMIIQQERQYSKEQVIGNPGFISQVSSDDAYVNSGGSVGYVNDKRVQSTVELVFELRLASCYLFFRLKSELVFDGHLCLTEADKGGAVAVVASIDGYKTMSPSKQIGNKTISLLYRKKIGGAILIVDALPVDEKHATTFGLMKKIGEEGRIIEFAEKPKGEQLKLDGLVMVPPSNSKRSFYKGPILQFRTKKASQRSVCC